MTRPPEDLSKTKSRIQEAASKPLQSAPPRKVGAYTILGEIARGGMGAVYRARDAKLGRDVALKMMLGGAWNSPDAQNRFLREARLLGDLSHPGIVHVHDAGLSEGAPFYTMDLVDGNALDDYVTEQKLPLEERLRLMVQVCLAVHYAHGRGIIHRDLKPGNILVRPDGSPVILDFGLARMAEPDTRGGAMTMTGTVMGTPQYMSPEQAQGRTKEIDIRTDVWALGVILYQLVTRRMPFQGEEALGILKAVVEKDPAPPSTVIKRLAPDLETVMLKALAKESSRRYDTARDLAEDLERFLKGEAVRAHPDTTAYRMTKWVQRNRPLAAVSAAALLLVVSVGSWSILSVIRAKNEALRQAGLAREAKETSDLEAKRAQAEAERALKAEGETQKALGASSGNCGPVNSSSRPAS